MALVSLSGPIFGGVDRYSSLYVFLPGRRRVSMGHLISGRRVFGLSFIRFLVPDQFVRDRSGVILLASPRPFEARTAITASYVETPVLVLVPVCVGSIGEGNSVVPVAALVDPCYPGHDMIAIGFRPTSIVSFLLDLWSVDVESGLSYVTAYQGRVSWGNSTRGPAVDAFIPRLLVRTGARVVVLIRVGTVFVSL